MSKNQERIALFLVDLKAALPIDEIAIEDESHLYITDSYVFRQACGRHF